MDRPDSRRTRNQAELFEAQVERPEWSTIPAEARALALALLVELFREVGRQLAGDVHDERGTVDE